jgi:hypothetical protein
VGTNGILESKIPVEKNAHRTFSSARQLVAGKSLVPSFSTHNPRTGISFSFVHLVHVLRLVHIAQLVRHTVQPGSKPTISPPPPGHCNPSSEPVPSLKYPSLQVYLTYLRV